MIVYCRNNEIDREKYDNCIKNSSCFKPFPYSWYLDIMAPGWQLLIDDDYDSVFPIPGFSRFGINYIATPVFLQQLGAFSPDKPTETAIQEFFDYLPGFYRFIDLSVGQLISREGFTVTERSNYVLDLSEPYEVLQSKFSRNCKRNIEYNISRKINVEDISSADLIRLFLQNKGKHIKGIKHRDFQRLDNLMNYCVRNNMGRIVGVKSSRQELIYGLFYIKIEEYMTMILLANTNESLEERIGFYVYNELIREASGSSSKFDFAGSSIPSVALFMKSFGSVNVPYYNVYRNRLFWPVRIFKQACR